MSAVGATILGCSGPRLTPDEAAFFAEANPWGFILFARNIEAPDQVRRLTQDLRAVLGRDAPVLIDQEGGRVQRMWAPHWREWHPPLDQMARTAPLDQPRAMWLRGRLIAHELRDLGIDANCSPVGDIASDATHPFLRNRCYGTDAATVAAAARATAEGHLAGGVLPVMKHIPGHGRAQVDSHHDLPRADGPLSVLEGADFAPFKALADLPLGMTAHVVYPALDPLRPGTTSPDVIAAIRDLIGFRGLLMTDDLSMNALPGSLAERAKAARDAGCDIILHCNGDAAEMAQVVAEAGPLTAQGAARAALDRRSAPAPLDIAAAEAELAALVDGGAYV